MPKPLGQRQIFTVNEWIGIVRRHDDSGVDPRALMDQSRGFYVNEFGHLTSEHQFWPVPVNTDGTIAGIKPDRLRVRAAAVGPIASSEIFPYEGRLVYVAIDIYPDSWAGDPPSWAANRSLTVVVKTGVRIEETDTRYFPPRGGVNWVFAHDNNPTYGPPWGNADIVQQGVDFTLYDGKMFVAIYDPRPHPDPNERFDSSDPASPVRNRGGYYVDYRPASGSTPDGPAGVDTKIAYGSVLRLTDSRVFYPAGKADGHRDRLFAPSHSPPGIPRLRYSEPGQAHKGGPGGGWPANNFIDVQRWEGWSIVAVASSPEALHIFTDPYGVWGLYGDTPADWKLTRISNVALVGRKSLARTRDGNFVILSPDNRMYVGRGGQWQQIDTQQEEYRDIADLRPEGPPIARFGKTIVRGVVPRSTLKGWPREGQLAATQLQEQWGHWGNRPVYVNERGYWSRSRYRFGMRVAQQTSEDHGDFAYDPSMDRLYVFGYGMQCQSESTPFVDHRMWYTDAAIALRATGRPASVTRLTFDSSDPDVSRRIERWNQFTARASDWYAEGNYPPDIAVFAPWYFGSVFDIKRIHSIFVTVSQGSPTHYSSTPQAYTQWWIRWKSRNGWSAPYRSAANLGDNSPADLGWQQLSLCDFEQDPANWTFNPNIPADGVPHRLGLIDQRTGVPLGDFGRGVHAIQLACTYNGTDPPVPIMLREIAVEYEVIRAWP